MEGQKEQTRQKEHVRLEFESNSRNEEFARVVAAVFMSRLDPTLEETQDVKTAVSEAVTNAIIHGYGKEAGEIFMDMTADPAEKTLTVCITDTGAGIADVKKAMEPLYTTDTTAHISCIRFPHLVSPNGFRKQKGNDYTNRNYHNYHLHIFPSHS